MIFDALVVGAIRNEAFRALVTVLAVALGVAVAVAIALTDAAVLRSAQGDAQLLAAPADLQIVGTGRGLDERVYARVSDLPGIEQARPIVAGTALLVVSQQPPSHPMRSPATAVVHALANASTYANASAQANASTHAHSNADGGRYTHPNAKATGRANASESVHIIGVDMLQPLPGVGNFSQREPGAFAPDGSPLDPRVTIEERGAVVSARIARRFGLRVGGHVQTLVGSRYIPLQVAAVLPLTVTGVDSSVVFVDVGTAQSLFGAGGLLDRVDLTVDGSLAAVRARVAAVLPPGVRVERPTENRGAVGRLLQEFELDFGVLGYLALILAATLVYGAVGTSVAQRRADIGTLRGLGATRPQIFGAFLSEGASFGAAGSLLGVVLGSFFAQYALVAIVPHVAGIADIGIGDDLIELGRAFALGVGVATLSAALPALTAMRIPPAQAMGARGFEGPHRGPRVSALVRAWPPWAFLAATNVAAAPKRTGVAVAALAVAFGATVGFATANASLHSALRAWAEESMAADLIVHPQTRALFDAQVIRRARHVAGIARIDASRTLPVAFRNGTIDLRGDDELDRSDSTSSNRSTSNELRASGGGSALRRDPGGGGMVRHPADTIASASLAARYGLNIGERIEVVAPAGRLALRVAAIRDDFGDTGGTLEIGRIVLARFYRAPGADTLSVFTKGNAAPSDVRTRLVQALAPMPLAIATTRELRAQAIGIFDRTFTIASSLAAISLLIAVCGIATTLGALVLERHHEIGLLRYAGATRATIRAMVLGEGALLGIFGSIAGLGLGAMLVAVQLGIVDGRLFGRSIAVHVPVDIVAATLAVTLVAAVLAALPPARLASRIATDAAQTPA